MEVKKTGEVLSPNDSWKCECGKIHAFNGYVAAHWNEPLWHTCENCHSVHVILSGVVELSRKGKKK